jgi:hypothetical protein
LDEWESWRKDCESKNPVRYWIAEKGLNKIQNIINFPNDLYYTLKIYIRNRWIDKSHYIRTGLEPGVYHEFDNKIIHGLFEELCDYIEVECATSQMYENKNKYKFVKGRCAEAGIDYLEWASSLKNEEPFFKKSDKKYGEPTQQAITSQKILQLYRWWKNRPNRPDPYKSSGWSDFMNLPKEEQNQKEKSKILKVLLKLEKQQDDEDTKMMIELIKIRQSIWI